MHVRRMNVSKIRLFICNIIGKAPPSIRILAFSSSDQASQLFLNFSPRGWLLRFSRTKRFCFRFNMSHFSLHVRKSSWNTKWACSIQLELLCMSWHAYFGLSTCKAHCVCSAQSLDCCFRVRVMRSTFYSFSSQTKLFLWVRQYLYMNIVSGISKI